MTEKKILPIGRRALLKGAGALAVGLSAPAILTRSARAETTITVADPGGPYGPAYRKAYYDPFEAATGIKVVNVARDAEPTAQFKAMVETRSYTWDVCTLTLSAQNILAGQDLLDPIGLTAADAPGLMKDALNDHWMGLDVYSTIFGYRSDHFGAKAPGSWAEFWDVKTFPAHRSLRKNPIDTLEQALMADGVAGKDLYPLDIDRAFKKLDEIKPHIDVWWTGGAQTSQLIQSGEVELISSWNARMQTVIDGGAPVKICWNQGLYSIEGWGLPKGGPKGDAARRFVKFCADPKRQAVMTEGLAYGPTNLDAYDSIPADRAPMLPTYKPNLAQMAIADDQWWTKHRAEVTERFNAWILA
ncbi:putative spermidine/putrescine transport system substrate-binding protein [Tistlia consotensis]|uniref:Putative spermidine/putrescine transport system substrate-binding protein n=1 Tax=Tistlia consotensis USBA 355 TaxID=560819 RepID=A0A1Y6CCM4_9PROT|nr:ABC transporter substrate-binding protein [Tistlia consotensis]SMF57055.1 putative spermidine/putrescine transport system substrate-binding protein [Tistlia consotensis USBA 355]SNR45280.1 putative spermidine/putrescine transport system substrate-binding protein [Tistlia consotensis]